ncbi:hypothetical protein JJB27_03665 [Campylobacter fetus subsp. venerealis]|uniref:hypothetical protein n=1 Tax=Campylobacter fetus TaxID=196 RepID=UPI0008189A5B|nr:hypothetical protein [Campylobacter fetus]MBK3498174.1 hypothetical protein [Campylobacter fetus subsp. venerealis]MBK3502194.1 hypothetical protein [Campylobacter fetus subsp. venerealis]OCS16810.1 hypothetical protein CfvWBT01109_01880 [Campylobacter fetus subsp. venerealis]
MSNEKSIQLIQGILLSVVMFTLLTAVNNYAKKTEENQKSMMRQMAEYRREINTYVEKYDQEYANNEAYTKCMSKSNVKQGKIDSSEWYNYQTAQGNCLKLITGNYPKYRD